MSASAEPELREKLVHAPAEYGSLAPFTGVKRTICKFFAEGCCEKGIKCTFAHGEEEIGEAMPEGAAVKPLMCKHWIEGHCHFGDQCKYAHGDTDRREAIVYFENAHDAGTAGVTRGACNFWKDGRDQLGSNCTFAPGEHKIGEVVVSRKDRQAPRENASAPHGQNVKRTVCKFWMDWNCQLGHKCLFAHGEHEIGKAVHPQDNSEASQAETSSTVDAGVKSTVCKLWEEGYCTEGDDGTCAHATHEIDSAIEDTPDVDLRTDTPTGANVKFSLCRFWEDGDCKHGKACTFAHGFGEIGQVISSDPPRTAVKPKACVHWDGGYCKHGEHCAFGHGKHEIEGTSISAPSEPSYRPNEHGFHTKGSSAIVEQSRALSKSKRTPCKSWAEGYCRLGKKCPYGHDPVVKYETLASDEPTIRQRDGFQPGTAMKRTICKFWEEGSCALGTSCTYVHAKQEVGCDQAVEDAPTPCRFWQQGQCKQGDFCAFTHNGAKIMRIPPSKYYKQTLPSKSEEELPADVALPKSRSIKHQANDSVSITSSDLGKKEYFSEAGKKAVSSEARKKSVSSGAGKKSAFSDVWKKVSTSEARKKAAFSGAGKKAPTSDAGKKTASSDQWKKVPISERGEKAASSDVGKKVCKFWQDSGFCLKAHTCTFAHNDPKTRTTSAIQPPPPPILPLIIHHVPPPVPPPVVPLMPAQMTRTLCSFWQAGNCQRGSQCTFVHGKLGRKEVVPCGDGLPTKLCLHWEQGRCLNGAACAYAHGGAELKRPTAGTTSFALDHRARMPIATPAPSNLSAPMLQLVAAGTNKMPTCKYWRQGLCQSGLSCTFSHSEPMISNMVRATASSTRHFSDKTTADAVTQAGHTAKTPRLWKYGTTHDGIASKFSHGEGELGKVTKDTQTPQARRDWKAENCSSTRGFSYDAEQDVEKHDMKRARTCKFWEEGRCERGVFCAYAHGEQEFRLRSPSRTRTLCKRTRSPCHERDFKRRRTPLW